MLQVGHSGVRTDMEKGSLRSHSPSRVHHLDTATVIDDEDIMDYSECYRRMEMGRQRKGEGKGRGGHEGDGMSSKAPVRARR